LPSLAAGGSSATGVLSGELAMAEETGSAVPIPSAVRDKMRSFVAKPGTAEKKWIVIDADGVVVGRLAAIISTRLRGKHKATYTPHVDTGDNVIVINARKVRLTGNKREGRLFRWHTGYPGGLKERKVGAILDGKFPERVVEKAVERMMPRGPLFKKLMRNLKIYPGAEHPHEAQKPEQLDVKAMNPKNSRD
jgi:large subunit ribosomal protein L13